MKRTEAVKLIGKVLTFGKDGFPPDKKQKYSQMSLADIILTELEEVGMLPPEYVVDYSPMITATIWEKEDDNNQLTDTK